MFISLDEVAFQQVVETWNQGFSDYLLPIHVDQESLEYRIQSLKLSKKHSAVFSMEGEFAGIILLGIQTFQQTKVMWIGGMAVIPKYRRNKVASKLMDYAENLAKENHCDHLILEVISTNERARKLYEAKGFQMVNELAIGTITLPTKSEAKRSIRFKPVSVKERALSENQWTPWQNRCIFSDKNYDIYQDKTKLGSISFNLAEESGDKVLILKQFYVPEHENKRLITDILLTLKEQENVASVKVANFDMGLPEYEALKKNGITLQLTQFQLAKKLR